MTKRTLLISGLFLLIAGCFGQTQPIAFSQSIPQESEAKNELKKRIVFENVSFDYDENVFSEISTAVIPATPLKNKDDKPDYVQSKATNFRLTYSGSKIDSAEISVFRVREYKDAFQLVPGYVESITKELFML